MAILSLIRLFTTLLSLAILAAAAYFLWSWYSGDLVQDAAGRLYRQRDDWRLWLGLGFAAWSLLGRFLVLALVARPDRRATGPQRGEGQLVPSPTGSSLYVEVHGAASGAPVIFTHGWGMDSTFWRYAREDLGQRFRLILWDLPGLGKSKPAGPHAISLEAFAADLASLVELAGRQRPVLVGHSIGGMIIQTLLRDHPHLQRRLAGVVLLNTTYTNPLKTMVLSRMLQALQRPLLEPASHLTVVLQPLVWLSKWQSYLSGSAHLAHRAGFGRFVTRSQLEHTTLLATRNSPAVQARGDLAMFHWDATGALGDAQVPALVIGGDVDIVTKAEASRAIVDEAAQGTLRIVPQVNHMGPLERYDVYDQLIADFVLEQQPVASGDLRPEVSPPGAPPTAPEGPTDRPQPR